MSGKYAEFMNAKAGGIYNNHVNSHSVHVPLVTRHRPNNLSHSQSCLNANSCQISSARKPNKHTTNVPVDICLATHSIPSTVTASVTDEKRLRSVWQVCTVTNLHCTELPTTRNKMNSSINTKDHSIKCNYS